MYCPYRPEYGIGIVITHDDGENRIHKQCDGKVNQATGGNPEEGIFKQKNGYIAAQFHQHATGVKYHQQASDRTHETVGFIEIINKNGRVQPENRNG